MLKKMITAFLGVLLLGCSAIKVPEVKRYSLYGVSKNKLTKQESPYTLFVSSLTASSGFETREMMYSKTPLELNSFVNSEWVAPPAKMLRSVIVSSLQNSGYFKAVIRSFPMSNPRFKVNINILTLKQNFIKTPSEVNLTLKVDVIDVLYSKVIASKRFTQRRNTTADTPYAGVVALNQASYALMERLSAFVVNSCRKLVRI